MTLQRMGIVFDNRLRPETTGLYVRRALHRLVPVVEHVLPDELARVPAGRFDALVVVDDGQPVRIPSRLRPAAWWAIDIHLDFNRALQDRALGLFHESLCHRGFLGLGAKESIDFSSFATRFDTLARAERIYRKAS